MAVLFLLCPECHLRWKLKEVLIYNLPSFERKNPDPKSGVYLV